MIRRIFRLLVAAALLSAGSTGTSSAQGTLPDGFYRYPTIGGGWIVFAAEGDLWKIPEAGGVAERLTASEGVEAFPHISPDGRWISFTAQYEGSDDVYVMSIDGGEPRRLTYHPAQDATIGWTADGRILFRSRRDTPHNDFRVYAIDPAGGLPELIPLEPAAWLSFEPGGSRVAYQKVGLEFHNWKRYQGGEAEDIYSGTLSPLAFKKITDWPGKDAFPMWHRNGLIYFVTDRWGRPNLASMKPDGSDVKKLTDFTDFDVRWPSMGGDRIVYQHKMDIWCYDIASGRNAQVPVQLPSDRLQVRERFVDPMATIGSWGLSPDGERFVIESRGDLFTARTKKKGLIRRITESSLSRTRSPAFSPDGRWIAAWTEVDGEEQLVLHSSDNSAPPRQVGVMPPGWHFAPAWSPDSRRLAWSDEKLRLRAAEVDQGVPAVVDSSQADIHDYAWSPDGRCLAYAVTLPTGLGQVRVWETAGGRIHPVSDPMFDSGSPTWDPDGKYLFYLSARRINPYLDRLEARFIVNNAMIPCVVALQADGQLPFAVLGDETPAPETKKKDADDDSGSGTAKERARKPPKPVRIDFDGLAGRVVEVPVDPGNYSGLTAIGDKLLWLGTENKGLMPPAATDDDEEPEEGATLYSFDIDDQKLSTIDKDVLGFDVSADNKVLLYRTKDGFTRLDATATSAPEGDAAEEARVDLSNWTIRINPRDEWKQMAREAWRLQRDFFYDPNMHGVDWAAMWKQYGPLTGRIASRDDLADLFGEMFGELSVGHAYQWGGDVRRTKPIGTGLLGADLTPDKATGFWRIDKIYSGNAPTDRAASPLARPDLRVRPGQWLVAIDGRPLQKGEDYMERLINRAGRETELSVNDRPKLEGARRVVIRPLASDTEARYDTWIRETRAYVDSVSHGQIGYIHLYDMGGRGLQEFARDFPPQWMKRGLIIDDRWNHGGWIAPVIVAHLDRKLLAITVNRNATAPYTTPDRCFNGYLSCLINRQGGSDCETLAEAFKEFGMGPVIGTRTWGGWVGIRGDKPLRDGGMTTQPEYPGWDRTGQRWLIEGHGVDPDVDIDLDPDGLIHGRDTQLDYAVRDLMAKIAKDPREFAPHPPFPVKPLVPVQ